MRSLASTLGWFRDDRRAKRRASLRARPSDRVSSLVESLEQRLLLTPTLVHGDAGKSGNRVDLVIVGDGYTASQVGDGSLFDTHIDNFLTYLFDENRDLGQDPFARYEDFFNVWRVDVASIESGADIPKSPNVPLSADIDNVQTTFNVNSAIGMPLSRPFSIQVGAEQMSVTAVDGNQLTVIRGFNGTTAAAHTANTTVTTLDAATVLKNTALGATYRANGGREDNLNVSQGAAQAALANDLIGTGLSINDFDMFMVAVNSNKFGGGGGNLNDNFAVFAAGDAASREFGLRELARQFSSLGLETDDGDTLNATAYAGLEPVNPNLTISQTGTFFQPHKWEDWFGFFQPGIGAIDTYEGGGGFDTGIYRPSLNSKLRAFGNPFDAVSREAIILDIYRLTDPLDSFTNNANIVRDPNGELRVVAVGDRGGQIGVSTLLSVDAPANQTFMYIDDASGLANGDIIQIDNEQVRVTARFFGFTIFTQGQIRTVDAVLIDRGVNGTIAQPHVAGSQLSGLVALDGDIDNSQTTFSVTGVSFVKRAVPFDIEIDNEQMTVTAIDVQNGTITVMRGINGTAAAAHTDGVAIAEPVFLNPLFQVSWQVNGSTYVTNSRTFRPTDFGLDRNFQKGQFTVKALIADTASLPTFQGGVDWVRKNPGALQEEIVWNFIVPSVQAPTPMTPVGVAIDALPTFTWAENDFNAVSWEFKLLDLDFGIGVINKTGIVGNSFTPTRLDINPSLLTGHNYRWHVRGVDAAGIPGAWSAASDFTVRDLKPTILSPKGVLSSVTPSFTWTPIAGAITYDLWVNDLTTGQSQVIRETNLTGTSFTPPPLTAGNTYLAAIRAIYAGGTAGKWSSAQDFTIQGAIGTPKLIAGMGSLGTTMPQLEWSAVQGATRYEVWVNDLTTGAIAVVRDANVTGTTFTPSTPLILGHDYLWTVRAFAGNVPGPYAPATTFSILANLAAPKLVGPNPSIFTSTPTFQWEPVAGAARYDLWVNDTTTGQSGVIRNKSVVGTSFTSSAPLTNGHGYIWTVRAIDANGVAGPWAMVREFQIGGTVGTPTLIGPSGTTDGSGNPITLIPIFQWNAVSGAIRYDIWVNDLTTGENAVIRNTNVTQTSLTSPIQLVSGHRYIWTVRAFNSQGTAGAWASHSTFEVASNNSPSTPLDDAIFGPDGETLTNEMVPSVVSDASDSTMLTQSAGRATESVSTIAALLHVQENASTAAVTETETLADSSSRPSTGNVQTGPIATTPQLDDVMADWNQTDWWADDSIEGADVSQLVTDNDDLVVLSSNESSSTDGRWLAAVAPALALRLIRRRKRKSNPAAE